jgi:hypothetical protein
MKKIYNKLILILSKFNRYEAEIISENSDFLKQQNYLQSKQKEVKNGDTVFFEI